MKNWKTINITHSLRSGRELKTEKIDTKDVIKILLKNRRLKTEAEIEEFLNPKLKHITIDSVGIDRKSLNKAIKRIKDAISKGEKIVIYGDYDVDGICATAILWETIYSIYKDVIPYIPSRIDEGYGLSIAGISNIKDPNSARTLQGEQKSIINDAKLIITVDNGISANEAVEFAKEQGIDVIITDHHTLPEKLPKAYSIIHTTKLCGAGVAYLLAQEIRNPKSDPSALLRARILNKSQIQNFKFKTEDNHLELVALATISDQVPLIGANRAFVKYGLKALSKTSRAGLLALYDIARLDKEKIGTYEVGYIIGPRLNATGRISHAMDSLRLLCTKNKLRAYQYAKHLDELNKQRQTLTEETAKQAKSQVSNFYPADSVEPISNIILVSHETYQEGVIGLIAGKLVEEYYRPSFVISVGEKYSKGSARSIYGVNIIELIRSVKPDLLISAGGHPMAAGFTIESARIEEFKAELEKKARGIITSEMLTKTVIADLVLDSSNINLNLHEQIQSLAPFGMSNPEPLFITEGMYVEDGSLVGRDKNHLKLRLEKDGKSFEAIAFGFGQKTDIRVGEKIDILYSLQQDTWNGNRKLTLKIKDVKVSS